MHTIYAHFPILPGPLPHPCDLLTKKIKNKREGEKEKNKPGPICVAHVLTEARSNFPAASFLKKTESFPTPSPTRSHQL